MKRIVIRSAMIASVGLMAVPAASSAFTFGAQLNQPPSNSTPPRSCAADSGGNLASPCTRVLVSSDTGYAGGHVASPKDGVITSFRIRAGGPGQIRFKIVRLKSVNTANSTAKGKAVAKSAKFQVQGNGFNAGNPTETFNVNMNVKKGDRIAVDSSKTSVERCTVANTVRQLLWAPVLKVSATAYRINDSKGYCTLMVQAIGHV